MLQEKGVRPGVRDKEDGGRGTGVLGAAGSRWKTLKSWGRTKAVGMKWRSLEETAKVEHSRIHVYSRARIYSRFNLSL